MFLCFCLLSNSSILRFILYILWACSEPRLCSVYSRIFTLQNRNRKTISNYIHKHTGYGTIALNSINIQMGILTPKEREDFILFTHSLESH